MTSPSDEQNRSSPWLASLSPNWHALGGWIATIAAFAVAYGQFPLYESNYNSYLVRGFARAGRGALTHDWLANTTDPFPVFSAFVYLPASLGWGWFFHLGQGALLGMFLYSVVRLVEGVYGRDRPIDRAILIPVLALPLVWLGRDGVAYVFGGDWGWYLQSGVAMQYVLGHMFQPSMFGVLCVASLAAFVHRFDRLAVALAAGAVLMHFTYVLTVVGLITGYSVVQWRETSDVRTAIRYAAAGFALCAVVSLPALRFLPSDPTTFAEATRILADIRIPHHALPENWLGHSSVLRIQGPLLVAGAIAAWRTRLRWPYLIVLALGTSLLGVQMMTGSRRLALLFPWRVSVILVPVAFCLVAAALTRPLWARRGTTLSRGLAAGLAVAAACYGFTHTRARMQKFHRTQGPEMMEAASSMAGPETLFVIPEDLHRFRLETGAPTFVDFKSHPYRDVEILEWHRRLSLVEKLESDNADETCATVSLLREQYGVTHFVRPADQRLSCDGLAPVFEGSEFVISTWKG